MNLKDNNYKEYLKKGTCVIEVSGESCANCLTLMPILNRLVSERNDCELHHVEVDNDTMEFVKEFEILTVPTILVFKNGELVGRCKGFQPEEILEVWLDSKLS